MEPVDEKKENRYIFINIFELFPTLKCLFVLLIDAEPNIQKVCASFDGNLNRRR